MLSNGYYINASLPATSFANRFLCPDFFGDANKIIGTIEIIVVLLVL